MPPRDPQMKILKRLSIDQIAWSQVLDLLVSKFKLPISEAKHSIESFMGRVSRMLHLGWFRGNEIGREDNLIVAALCEYVGADSILLVSDRKWSAATLFLGYHQELELTPALKRGDELGGKGTQKVVVTIDLLGKKVDLTNPNQIIVLQIFLFIVGVWLYVLFFGVLLYSFSVFASFLQNPKEVMLSATRVWSVGLALVGTLVVFVAVFGRVAKNILKILVRTLRK